jgi:regulator of RNase E activity RraB
MTDTYIQAAMDAHRQRNESLLSELQNRGVDPHVPRSIQLNFWSPDQRSAAFLAKALYERSYLVLVLSPAVNPAPGRQWNLEVGANMAVERAVSGELTRELIELASEQSSEYDGWGTSV